MITIDQIHIRLADALTRSGLKQTELAERLRINQGTISSYISGRRHPSLEMFANLCAILDVDTNDILCIDSFSEN